MEKKSEKNLKNQEKIFYQNIKISNLQLIFFFSIKIKKTSLFFNFQYNLFLFDS
jgi:hypothetical protein